MARLPSSARGALAAAAGALTALGLPPIGAWPLAFIGIPVLLLLLETAKLTRWRSGFGTGWLFGLGYFTVAFHWIGYAFFVEADTYLWMMPFMLGALSGGMALYWGLAAVVSRRIASGGLPLALAFAATLGTAEYARGHLFTGFPWAAPGQMVDGMGGLAQAASLIGMTGLTLVIVLWAALPWAALRARGRGMRLACLVLLAPLPLLWAWGDMRLATAGNETVPGVAFRIVQPNVPQEQKWREDNARGIFEDLKQLSAMPTTARPDGIAGVTHLVWPESAVPFLIDESPVARAELAPMLGGRTTLITGAIRLDRKDGVEEPDAFNSMIVFDGTARPVARYDKWRLVPGGEFLPLAWLLEPLGFRKVVQTPGSFTAGSGPRTLELPGGLKAALLVCYEVIFPDRLIDESNRPQVLVNVTNDGWFGASTGPWQHLAQVRLRAIERGLPVIRAANTGISAVIDPYGRYLRRLPLLQQGVIDSPLPAVIPPTPYEGYGDLALFLLAGLALAAAFRGESATGSI